MLGKGHQINLMAAFEKGPKGSGRANVMEIWEKSSQTEKTVSAKTLRYELDESEEQEGGQFSWGEFNSHKLVFMEKKCNKRKRSTHF